MDWIKMRVALERDPKTIKLKKTLAADPAFQASPFGAVPPIALAKFVVGCLLNVWGTVNAHIEGDDLCGGIDLSDIDDMAGGVPGFGLAMAAAPWAEAVNGGVCFPNFRELNTPAKERGEDRIAQSAADRARQYRGRKRHGASRDVRDGASRSRHGDDESASREGVTRVTGASRNDGSQVHAGPVENAARHENVTDGRDENVTRHEPSRDERHDRLEENREEERRVEEKNPPYPPSKKLKPVDPKSPEARLCTEWLLRRRVHTEPDRHADAHFHDLIALGVTEATILAAIKDSNLEAEPIWDFCKRLRPKARAPARKGEPMSSTKAFMSGGGEPP